MRYQYRKIRPEGKPDRRNATFSNGGKNQDSDLTITLTGKVGADGLTGTIDVDPFNATSSFSAKKGAAAAKPKRKHKT